MLILKDTDQNLRMQTDLKMGLPIIFKRGTINYIVFSTETISEENFKSLWKLEGEKPYLCVTARRAQTLKARVYDNTISKIKIPNNSDLSWIKATADPVLDLDNPLKGPYSVVRGADSSVEKLSIDWCKKSKLIPACIVKKISKKTVQSLENKFQILSLDFSVNSGKQVALIREEQASAKIPINGVQTRLRVFKLNDENFEHCAIEFGNPDRKKSILTRIHSACFTGDVLDSQKCDCGSQLREAINKFTSEGEGILLYLNQEGRGIGLLNKVRAYRLQEQGFDTVDANHRLGFEDEERDFQIGAEILKTLGFSSARLLTNNPKKIHMLEKNGIQVQERVSLLTEPTDENFAYLRTKAKKSGHIF